jgi:hypothetical protein
MTFKTGDMVLIDNEHEATFVQTYFQVLLFRTYDDHIMGVRPYELHRISNNIPVLPRDLES